MFRICAFILLMIVSCGIKVLSYLWLFLEVQISYSMICSLVRISLLVSLLCLLVHGVSRCCCELVFLSCQFC